MATIYANSSDGWVANSNANWATCRDSISGSTVSSSGTVYIFGVRADVVSGRGGTTYYVVRSFFSFDCSGITQLVEDASLRIYGGTNSSGDVIAVEATGAISSLGTVDFDAITGWSAGSADGSGAGDNESNVTKYSDEIDSWSTSGYNIIPLNSTAKAKMLSRDTLNVCLMNYDQDLKDIAPTGTNRNGLYYQNYTGTSRDPLIRYDLSLSNAVFMGTNF